MFQVRIINTRNDRYSGLTLEAGEEFQAKDGGKPFCYLVLVDGDWVNIDADNASVVHDCRLD